MRLAKQRYLSSLSLLLTAVLVTSVMADSDKHQYNGSYSGRYLDHVAFPIGGIGAGMFCLEGTGAISHMSVRNTMEFFNEPTIFPVIYVNDGVKSTAKVLEGPVPSWKVFGRAGTGLGSGGKTYGLPRFENVSFKSRFPFGTVKLSDEEVPLEVSVTGWSPFTPGNVDDSCLPVGALEYTFTNTSSKAVESVFSFNSVNFLSLRRDTDRIVPTDNGFILTQKGSPDAPEKESYFSVFTDDSKTVVDHCWFRGGWWDPFTVAWNTISSGKMLDNPKQDYSSPGASLFVPFQLEPGQSKTVRVMIAWYTEKSHDVFGTGPNHQAAFGSQPSRGTAPGQQEVRGYIGGGLVNTYDYAGDNQIGTLTSPGFVISEKFIQFLIGGGAHEGKTCMNLKVEGKTVLTAVGNSSETLDLKTWDVSDYQGKTVQIEIIDQARAIGWGHILVDHIVMTSNPSKSKNKLNGKIIADFEGGSYKDWAVVQPERKICSGNTCDSDSKCDSSSEYYEPWYAGRFKDVKGVIRYWTRSYDRLKSETETFTNAFYDTTLPPEVIEAVAANLTILKSPTVLRQKDGRFWGWEGCNDSIGCCPGSCTHVWNYAQAVPHLFPSLERSFRNTEFNINQNKEGHQTFRTNLPIVDPGHDFHAAADGQLGGIMKVYREWRISGDTEWLEEMWPKVCASLDYCIRMWDPRHAGALEEPHHNTYDIEYWGPEGHCMSFYVGALNAAVKMGKALDKETHQYSELLDKSIKYLKKNLYNGEYFYQKVTTDGLNAKFWPLDVNASGPGYRKIAETVNSQGPKYQYGTGCLSDGVLGFWIARVCGLDEVMDSDKIASHLTAVHKYNFRSDLYDHANPQRPSYALGHEAGLLLCSWPNGGKPMLPFVYSDEVWTGIEYQVASHLMMHGQVKEGLEIVRGCRDRYNGCLRNPFNEYECGHWYARAMSSYGLLQGLTGVRYDAVEKTLYIDSRIGNNFRSFLSTATGFGTVGQKNGKPFVDVKSGKIEIEKMIVSGKEMKQ